MFGLFWLGLVDSAVSIQRSIIEQEMQTEEAQQANERLAEIMRAYNQIGAIDGECQRVEEAPLRITYEPEA